MTGGLEMRAMVFEGVGRPLETEVTTFDLAEANEALEALRNDAFEGSGVLTI